MPQLTQQSIKELLAKLQENITRFIESYKGDRKKIKPSVMDYIKKIEDKILTDIKKDQENKSLNPSITIYDGYLRRLTDIAKEADEEAPGFFVDDKVLLTFSKSLSTTVSTDLNNLRSEFLDELESSDVKRQKTEQESDVKEIKQQLGTLTNELKEAVNELKTTKEALQGLGQLFQFVTIDTPDDKTYKQLTALCETLQLSAPPLKRIENALASKPYFPFLELKEDKFGVEDFDPSFFKNKQQLEDWKNQPKNRIVYEKLKLSECVNTASMYAAVIELAELLKKCSTNQHASFQSDPKLEGEIKSVLADLIGKWDQSWSICKERVITPALDRAPSLLLKECLEKISSFNHANDSINENLYSSKEFRVQALLSVVYYKGSTDQASHLLPKLEAAEKNLKQQLLQSNGASQQVKTNTQQLGLG